MFSRSRLWLAPTACPLPPGERFPSGCLRAGALFCSFAVLARIPAALGQVPGGAFVAAFRVRDRAGHRYETRPVVAGTPFDTGDANRRIVHAKLPLERVDLGHLLALGGAERNADAWFYGDG